MSDVSEHVGKQSICLNSIKLDNTTTYGGMKYRPHTHTKNRSASAFHILQPEWRNRVKKFSVKGRRTVGARGGIQVLSSFWKAYRGRQSKTFFFQINVLAGRHYLLPVAQIILSTNCRKNWWQKCTTLFFREMTHLHPLRVFVLINDLIMAQ